MTRNMITDEIWNKISPLLPPENGYWGRPSRPHREILEGILWILRTGAPWRDLPPDYGTWQSVYGRYNRWVKKGHFNEILEILKKRWRSRMAHDGW